MTIKSFGIGATIVLLVGYIGALKIGSIDIKVTRSTNKDFHLPKFEYKKVNYCKHQAFDIKEIMGNLEVEINN